MSTRAAQPTLGPCGKVGLAILAALLGLAVAAAASTPPAGAAEGPAPAAREPGVRDVSPTKLERGDRLVVELEAGAPRGPAFIILRRSTPARPEAAAPLVLRGQALGDGRVAADIDASVEARVGRDVRWPAVAVEVTLIDTGEGDVWAATGGQRVWRSGPGDTYELDFFPRTVRGLAADAVTAFGPLARRHPALTPAAITAAVMIAVALVILLLVAPATGLLVVWERKIAGRMQSRFGPNRVGPSGWLQWLADALKLIRKEDLVPLDADPILFRLAPYLAWAGIFATFVVLPLSEFAIVADLNVGILYLTSVTTFTVIGIVMGGWASNSKWSLLGGMRSAAQIISYELPASIALLSVVVAAGTLAPQAIVRAQGGLPHDWFVFRSPFTFVAFFIYFISALAEGNRTPFDLPEAESELVAGFTTEYSGFRWSIFSLAEWTNVYVMSAIVATVFLGGWNVPFVSPEAVAASPGWRVASLGVMLAKVALLSFVVIWIRWSLPRFRVDQMMSLCWKWLLPAGLAMFMASTAWTWVETAAPRLGLLVRWSTFLLGGVGLFAAFLRRVVRTFRATPLLHAGARQFTLPLFERRLEKR
ncbi:MAG TPA: NADH-quinone oxidoreductase subunit NuoH [Polyangia bacterium]